MDALLKLDILSFEIEVKALLDCRLSDLEEVR